MKRKRFVVTVLVVIVTGVSAFARSWFANPAEKLEANGIEAAKAATPDLLIREFVFPADNEKTVRVHILNAGRAASGLCILGLTVHKINGVSVGRVTEVKLPPLAAGKDKWLIVNAKSILPSNISLESTTFKLNADATSIVAESNESNNEVWHNQ